MPITPNRPLGNGGCMGRWGTLNIENHVWGPWCVISGQIFVSWCMHYVWYSQLASEERHITPNRPLRNGCIWQQYGARETHWPLKTMSGALMFSFGRNNPFLIYASCVILPTGDWGTPHFSQPATEEWVHLIALLGTWNTSHIGHMKHITHLGGLDT